MSLGGGGGIAGYKYFFGIHAGIGRGPMDELVEIRVGTKLAAQPHMTESGTGTVNAADLFGGDSKEGGIQGDFHLLMGEPTQLMPEPLAAMIAPVEPTGYRRRVTFFFDGLVASLNPYPKPWSFRMRRWRAGWDGEVLAPELAMIELLGPEAPVGGSASGPAFMPAEMTIQGPLVYYARAFVSIPIGAHLGEIAPIADETTQVYKPLGFQNVSGGAYILFAPEEFNKTTPFAYTIVADGSPNEYGGVYVQTTLTINQVPNAIGGTVTPASGGSPITQLVEIRLDNYSTGELVPVVSANYNSDGSMTVRIVPDQKYWGQSLYVTANTSTQVGQYFRMSVTDMTAPIYAQATPPPGLIFGTYTSVKAVVAPGQQTGGEIIPPLLVDIPFTVDGDNLALFHPAASGKPLIVSYTYLPAPVEGTAGALVVDRVIKAMNPAHIIFECLTNREWGRGYPRTVIDTASFAAAAQTLYDEGFGMCLRWARRDSIDTFIKAVIDTISATMYVDPTTALMTLKLVRKDYDVANLKVWDTSNGILAIQNSTLNTSTVSINEVIVKYRDPVYNEDRSVNVQNLAALQSNGGIFNTITKEYRGIPTGDLARRVAQRDLRANAEGLRRFTITMDRRGSKIVPGLVMRIQDVARNIKPTVVRVASSKTNGNSGEITLDVMQDVFSFPATSFVAEQPNTWVPPNFTPCIGEHDVFEVPYFMLARRMSAADFAQVGTGSAYIGVVAERAKPTNMGFNIAVRDGEPTPDDIPTSAEAMYCGYEP